MKEPLLKEEKNIKKNIKINFKELSFFNRFFLKWAFDIIKISNYKNIKKENLIELCDNQKSNYLFENFYNIWEKKQYKNKKILPLLQTSIRSNLFNIIIIFITIFLNSIINIFSIQYFRKLIKQFDNKIPINKENIIIAITYLFLRSFYFILQRKNTELLINIGNQSEIELNCLIYNKLLKISPNSQEINSGKIFNFLQNDSHKLFKLMSSCPNIISIPFLIVMYNYLIYKYMGNSFYFSLIVMIIFNLINFYFRTKFTLYLKLYLKKIDYRMKICSETFNNLKVIKLYGWDEIFLNKIKKSREDELNALYKRLVITQISQTLLWLTPIAMSVVSIGAYQYYNNGDKFKIEDIFSCLGIFTSMQAPMRNLPVIIDNWNETIISLKRIEKFLKLNEINEKLIIKNNKELMDKGIAIQIENGNFSWGISRNYLNKKLESQQKKEDRYKIKNEEEELKDINENSINNLNISYNSSSSESKKTEISNEDNNNNNKIKKENFQLNNINLTIKKGEFICIIGETGSGKSSLLHSILNNMQILTKNSFIINGNIAYVSQEPFIQNTTIQNNILYYNKYNEINYNKIINLCDLKTDLEKLDAGDLTEIGERGVNLSGGQKSRISLARAIYSDKDIYILDDPLNTLDVNVGLNIINNCLVGYLKGKTILMATNELQYLSYSDKVLFMEEGKIKWIGKYEDLEKEKFFKDFSYKIKNIKNENKIKNEELNLNENDNKKNNQIKKIIQDEKKFSGNIDKSVYFSYFKYIGGKFLIFSLIIILIIWQSLKISSDIWLGFWSENQGKYYSNQKYFYIFAILALSSSIFNYLRTVLITSGSLKCSKKLHDEMISSFIKAPISLYHETIPKGRIINRLSKDLTTVDTFTMYWFLTLTSYGSSFLGAVFICVIYQWHLIFLLPILFFLAIKLIRFYMNCSRELTRIESMLISPLINLINETIPGNSLIRIYNYQEKYVKEFEKRIDDYFKIKMLLNGTQQIYILFLNIISFVFLSFLILTSLFFKENLNKKIIGILLIYSIILQNDLIEFLIASSNFENTMIRMERSLSSTKIISEKPQETLKDKSLIEKKWPNKGKIQFKNFSVKYRPDTEIVLNNLNFEINPGEHLGIVGRTGSGKSTIALSLFRIIEPLNGSIYIDDIDISEIGLKILRNNLTIIPQEPFIMDGTLRYNIDPLGLYSDNQIVEVMKNIGFNYIIENHIQGLNQKISENGGNLSIGEKQLICITRAILRKTKIVIIDEATANIDYKTEKIIQNAINEILKQSTLITIAHRIKMIMNSDKVLILDNGNLVEFDTVKNLLDNKKSLFYDLYKKSL